MNSADPVEKLKYELELKEKEYVQVLNDNTDYHEVARLFAEKKQIEEQIKKISALKKFEH